MFRLEKEFQFEASHQLTGHDGKCARLHGHSWKGRLVVEGRDLVGAGPKENMLVDYEDVERVAKDLELQLDHKHLNDVLKTEMPTSEFVAKWCFDHAHLDGNLWDKLVSVVIEENCMSRCEYRP